MSDKNQPLLGAAAEEEKAGEAAADLQAELELARQTNKETGLSEEEVLIRRDTYGYNELAEEEENALLKFLSYFWGPMPAMIWAAVIIELIKGIVSHDGWEDFGVLLFLQIVNGTVGYIEEMNAGNAIAALKERLAPMCRVKRGGVWQTLPSRELVPGDLLEVKLGDIVPADCMLLDGQPMQVDQSALTGESLPVTLYPGEKAKMGSTVKRGELHCVVVATGSNTFFGKAADLMNIDDHTGRFQKILFQITLALLGVSVVLVAIMFVKLMLDKTNFLRALSVVIVLLVASIPIAMQVVCTSTMAVGARRLAARKVIVARLSAIEELAGMTILCSDKTGTLTQNKLSLRDPILMGGDNGFGRDEIIFYSALSARRTPGSQDAIDYCITQAVPAERRAQLDTYRELEFIPFNPTDKRTESTVVAPRSSDSEPEQKIKITKGAPQVILRMAHNASEIVDQVDAEIQQLADRGFRALGVAICNVVEGQEDVWEFQGLLSLYDPPRHDTKETVTTAVQMGVEVKMVTGDQTAIAKETCRDLGMGTNILNTEVLNDDSGRAGDLADIILNSNGFAEVYPEHKFQIVDIIRKEGHVTGMTGDGVNDAPALKRADIGIAVEGATDAAKAAADIVLIEPGLSVIIEAIQRSRKIFQRMRNYCIYRIACTIELLLFFFFAVMTVSPNGSAFYGPAQPENNENVQDSDGICAMSHDKNFILPVIALVVITILNDGTIITIAYDKVIPANRPQVWDLSEVVVVSSVLGLVACLSSILLLVLGMQARIPCLGGTNWIGHLTSDRSDHYLTYYEVQTMLYLKISVSDFLTVFAARCRSFFWERRPGYALGCAAVFALGSSTLLSVFWDKIFGHGGDNTMIGLTSSGAVLTIWVYSFVWFIIQDICKVAAYFVLDNYVRTENQERLDDMGRKAYTSSLMESDARAYRGVGGVRREASLLGGHETQRLRQRVDELEKQVAKFAALQATVDRLQQTVGNQ